MRSLLGLFVLISVYSSADAQLFQITKLQFSSHVSDDGSFAVAGPATEGKISRSSLKDRELFFSFTIVGFKNAVDHLRQNRKLDTFVIVYAGIRSLANISCGIFQDRWRSIGHKLIDKYNEDGLFTFRTLVTTQQTEHDQLTFIVRDQRGTEIERTEISIIP